MKGFPRESKQQMRVPFFFHRLQWKLTRAYILVTASGADIHFALRLATERDFVLHVWRLLPRGIYF